MDLTIFDTRWPVIFHRVLSSLCATALNASSMVKFYEKGSQHLDDATELKSLAIMTSFFRHFFLISGYFSTRYSPGMKSVTYSLHDGS